MQAAPDVETVGKIMRDYVTTIPPPLLNQLPSECQRALANSDIQYAAVAILHCELGFKGDTLIAEMLHEVAHTYAAASLRITRLTKEEAPGE